jgi:lipopolysaccharide export system protein LptA
LTGVENSYVFAENETTQPDNNIKILADEMECDQQTGKCIATGNAVAQKLNDPEGRTIAADKLITFFAKKDPQGPSKLTRIEAEGNVVITTGETIIRAPRGYYNAETEYAELFEDVRATNAGKNHLVGNHGDVYMNTGQYKVTSANQQVQALIFTKDDNKTTAQPGTNK